MNQSSTFLLPDDGWYHIALPGDWPHKPTGLIQVVDNEALDSIIRTFDAAKATPSWPGLLIDFDHQSLDVDKPSVAAGWVNELQKRDDGLWAQIRWSDLGQEAVQGGRYRFISPVWKSSDCAMLEGDRIRPMKLMNCAVTNDPNIKGMNPLSNSAGISRLRFAPPAIPIANKAGKTKTIKNLASDATMGHFANASKAEWTDEQRKRFFASQRGGSGGGGKRGDNSGGPGKAGNTEPSKMGGPVSADDVINWAESKAAGVAPLPKWSDGEKPYTPKPAASPAEAPTIARNSNARIENLREQRAYAETLAVPPEPKKSFAFEDPRAARDEVLRRGGNAGEALKAEADAKTRNRVKNDELNEVKANIAATYKTEGARDRAFQRYLNSIDKNHEKAMGKYERDVQNIAKAISEIDKEIAKEEVRLSEAERKADIELAKKTEKATTAAEKAAAKSVNDQVKKDIAEKRLKLLEIQLAEKQSPVNVLKLTQKEDKAYRAAIAEGRLDLARQIRPDLDVSQHANDYAAATDADFGEETKRKKQAKAWLAKPLPPKPAIANRDTPMDDDQRKAMWARMNGSGGSWGSRTRGYGDRLADERSYDHGNVTGGRGRGGGAARSARKKLEAYNAMLAAGHSEMGLSTGILPGDLEIATMIEAVGESIDHSSLSPNQGTALKVTLAAAALAAGGYSALGRARPALPPTEVKIPGWPLPVNAKPWITTRNFEVPLPVSRSEIKTGVAYSPAVPAQSPATWIDRSTLRPAALNDVAITPTQAIPTKTYPVGIPRKPKTKVEQFADATASTPTTINVKAEALVTRAAASEPAEGASMLARIAEDKARQSAADAIKATSKTKAQIILETTPDDVLARGQKPLSEAEFAKVFKPSYKPSQSTGPAIHRSADDLRDQMNAGLKYDKFRASTSADNFVPTAKQSLDRMDYVERAAEHFAKEFGGSIKSAKSFNAQLNAYKKAADRFFTQQLIKQQSSLPVH